MKLDISKWGSAGWDFLQAAAFKYPRNPTDKDKNDYASFFTNVQNVLPCDICKEHYGDNLKRFPIDLRNTRSLTQWINRVHNNVNISNGKPVYPYLKMVADYSPFCPDLELSPQERSEVLRYLDNHSVFSWSSIVIIILIIVLIAICVCVFVYRNNAYKERSRLKNE